MEWGLTRKVILEMLQRLHSKILQIGMGKQGVTYNEGAEIRKANLGRVTDTTRALRNLETLHRTMGKTRR